VRALLDRRGAATYRFAPNVAWDRIPVPPRLRKISPAPAAVVYGTLALRETPNRRALAALIEAWPEALRVVDLNFREPFATRAAIEFALKFAQFVKLNDDELAQLTGARGESPAALRRSTESFARSRGIDRVCVTAGARGAGLWWRGEWHWEPARRVSVRDTVGAGDAFLGGLLGALLARETNPALALASACRMGEFVASRDGATPPYELDAGFRPTDSS
jgi:fructokinase